MQKQYIHQIYYSDRTRAELDPGFVPLDNLENERPDWREYWPMRQFLLNHTLEPDAYYGFFSPKFRLKTGLEASMVREFVDRYGATSDVISFSPFFDQMVLPLNVVEQAVVAHPGSLDLFRQCVALLVPQFRIDSSVMTSLNTVFCNFFVAKPPFWTEWLRLCEPIFQIAEEAATPLARELNRVAQYGTQTAPAKVFVIERLASLLLWSQPQWRMRSYDPMLLPLSSAQVGAPELVVLDALKIAYTRRSSEHYLTVFKQLRQTCLQSQPPAAIKAAS